MNIKGGLELPLYVVRPSCCTSWGGCCTLRDSCRAFWGSCRAFYRIFDVKARFLVETLRLTLGIYRRNEVGFRGGEVRGFSPFALPLNAPWYRRFQLRVPFS
jgi:hypothetical protein